MESSRNTSDSPLIHRYNTRLRKREHCINYNEDSDVSDNDFIESDNNDFNHDEYRKFVSELFPSRYIDNKIKNYKILDDINKSKRFRFNEVLSNDYSTNFIIAKPPNNTNIIINNNDEESIEGESDREDDEYDEESDREDDEYDEESDREDDEYDEESDMEDDEYDEESNREDDEYDEKSRVPSSDSRRLVPSLNYLADKLMNKQKHNIIDNLVKIANQRKRPKSKQDKLEIKKQQKINNNVKEFRKLLLEKDNLNDLKYFKTELTTDNQETMIKEMKILNNISTIDKPYRIILLESGIPSNFKISALKKISMMENMDPSVGEYFKLKNWIDTFMRIPFNKFNNLPFNISDGLDKCNEYMEQSITTLDKAVYGLNDAKMQIMQLIGQWIVNPSAVGSAIAIKGPMGTGKTTLVKEGISKILNRPFALIALGGATDSSVLEGHGYTYEGSMWGKIVDILIQTQCSNPIIYFDELDKVSDTPRGEEIIGILTHLIDSTQNNCFHDKYFSEIDFDLSKALFIFSYNDESKVNSILLDRMYKITTKGYDLKDKKIIANDYLIPSISKQVNFESDNIVISDEALHHIIEKYTIKEDGVRNLKRCLEIIHTKLNLFRLMKPDSVLFKDDKSLKVEFPFTVTPEIIDKLIKKEAEGNDNWKVMYM
jgi:ATP-dependent Lon protease